MGPKKAASSKSPSKSNRNSPAKRNNPTDTQPSTRTTLPTTLLPSPIRPSFRLPTFSASTDTQITTTQQYLAQPATEPAPTEPNQPAPESFTFKGHLQPPVNERLLSARYFLADEDPNRCLEFDTKITQIEEFVAQIEKDNVACDAQLFRDVKTKLEVHMDWEERLKISPFDTGCCDAPLIQRFSTRLVSSETAVSLRQEREAQGLVTQMREDHAPFTVNPEKDHGAFLAKLKEDSSTDPDAIDQDTNLLWTESRAYMWAMRDPALIPHWMNPTYGIPTKGLRNGEVTNAPQREVSDVVKSRPARGYVPAYLLATEKKINSLLKQAMNTQAPIDAEGFQLLESLLCQFEPKDLHDLHTQHASFIEAAALGSLSENEETERDQVKARFIVAQSEWLQTFGDIGVYLVIRTPGQHEVQQPGVFYVDDGIMTPEQLDTRSKAQALLDRLLRNGRMDLTEQENASLDNLMHDSLPANVREIENQKSRILEKAGANCIIDLAEAKQREFDRLQEEGGARRLKWEEELRRSGGAEFRYLRPGEMMSDRTNILYLPWTLTSIPTASVSSRLDLELPPVIQHLQEVINDALERNINLFDLDLGRQEFRTLLEQVAYPSLRDLLGPLLALRVKQDQGPLEEDEKLRYDTLCAEIRPAWQAWWNGFGTKITIKIPRPEQHPETPEVIYCRMANNGTENLDTYYKCKADRINHLLRRGESIPDYWELLAALFADLEYPALKKIHERFRLSKEALDEAEAERLGNSWRTTFARWILSKKPHTIRIKKPNPRIDPDDDPTVVYYRGLVPKSFDLTRIPEDVVKRVKLNLAQGLPLFPQDIWQQLPPSLQRTLKAREKASSPALEILLDWHIKAFTEKGQETSEKGEKSDTPSSASSFGTTESGDGGNGNGHGRRDSNLGVDLTRFMAPILAVESEINHLLEISRKAHQPLEFLTVLQHYRLFVLLRQFFPDDLFNHYERSKRVKAQLKTVEEDDAADSTRRLSYLERCFNREYQAWYRTLRETGVRINTSMHQQHQFLATILTFQPLVTGVGSGFSVLAPEINSGPEMSTSKLVQHHAPADTPPNPSPEINRGIRKYLADRENVINALLDKRRTSALSWDDTEDLAHNLILVMPLDLAQLYKEFREVDERVRNGVISDGDAMKWWELLALWQEYYEPWLSQLTQTGIRIVTGDHNDDHPGILKLQVPEVFLPLSKRRVRMRQLPQMILDTEDHLNTYLNNNKGPHSEEEEAYLEELLWPLSQPVLSRLQKMIKEKLELLPSVDSERQPEDDALVQAIVALAQKIFVQRFRVLSKGRRVSICEPVPWTYTFAISKSTLSTRTQAEIEREAEYAFARLCIPFLDDTKKQFHDTAARIRMNTMTPEDFNILQQVDLVQSAADLHRLAIAILDSSMFLPNNPPNQANQDLLKKWHWRWLWHRWAYMFPELSKQAKNQSAVQIFQAPRASIEALLNRRLSGSAPRSRPPLVGPPSAFEVKELEIEIDNLLMRERSGRIEYVERLELNYLLRALLSPRLRYLKQRIDALEAARANEDGLSLARSIALVDATKQFEPQFRQFKKDMPPFGVILDEWFSTSEAIAEACSRARLWKEATKKDDGTYSFPATSRQIEDTDLATLHVIYDTLKPYVEAGCVGLEQTEDQLLLRFMPQQLISLKEQIGAQENSQTTPGLAQSARLQNMKNEFIEFYLGWFASLTPTQVRKFQDQSKTAYSREIYFGPKAERRGIQRAAIELALNLLATNQEQHRPNDRFRIVDLPAPIQFPEKEVPLCLPLKPEDRPLEQDPFEYTRKMLAFRQWKDFDYRLARLRTDDARGGSLPAPDNHKGPAAVASTNKFHEAVRSQVNNLASTHAALIVAVKSAPRPLLEQLLLLVDAGLHYDTQPHRLADDENLTEDGLNLLEEISEDSWDEEKCEYGTAIPGLLNTSEERGRLEEFEDDIAEITDLPLWQPEPKFEPSNGPDSPELFTQIQHDPRVPSTRGMTGDEVRQDTGNRRMAKTDGSVGTPHLWDLNTVTRYLRAMESAGRIHLDDLPNGDVLVSRIPLSGHPENKYVISRADASSSPGVITDEEGKLEVRYDSVGNVGPPIVQPNKFHYLQRLAFRLGRDLKYNATILAAPDPAIDDRIHQQLQGRGAAEAEMENITPADRSEDQNVDVSKSRIITLQRLAQDLHKIAPDLAEEAGFEIDDPSEITEKQAATLLQMQILEEASNNWELKFPENENVWEFASSRLETTTRTINGRTINVKPRLSQFFHMRRFPPCCQSDTTKTAIQESGPTIEERPEPAVEEPATATAAAAEGLPKKKARHIRGREPYFSFGESAYERAFLSWRMEQELKDVPEFQVKKPHRSWFWKFRHRKNDDDHDNKTDRYPLPKIPASWVPDNVSIAEKRTQVIELAKRTPAFPNPEILEYYHTPGEIEQIRLQREWDAYALKRRVAMDAVERYTKKKYDFLTRDEIWAAQAALKINQTTGVFIVEPAAGRAGDIGNLGSKAKNTVRVTQQSATARRHSGPARNTRSRRGDLPATSGALPVQNDNGRRAGDGSH